MASGPRQSVDPGPHDERKKMTNNSSATLRAFAAVDSRVWLPLPFPGTRKNTGFSQLTLDQLGDLADSIGDPNASIVAPTPLGVREVFANSLKKDLASEGEAFQLFSLLVEAIVYGKTELVTYDLNKYALKFTDDDRYLTLIKFKSHPGSPATVVGSFSPTTLVCPAANLRLRDDLQGTVLAARNTDEAVAARGLLRAFWTSFPSANSLLWSQALQKVIEKYGPRTVTGEVDQRNTGQVLLRTSPNAAPEPLFFPQYRKNYLSDLSRRLVADTSEDIEGERVLKLNHRPSSIFRNPKNVERPELFGAGCEVLGDASNGGYAGELDRSVIRHLGEFTNVYFRAGEPAVPRFKLPDCLRCFYWKFGRAAFHLLQPQPYLYSPALLDMLRNHLPHETYSGTGYFDNANDSLLVEAVGAERYAYYVERYDGKQIGDLRALGYALWLLFCGEADWNPGKDEMTAGGQRILCIEDQRFSTAASLQTPPVDPLKKAADLLAIVQYVNGLRNDDLFAVAASTYLGPKIMQAFNKGSDSTVEPVLLGGRHWSRIKKLV